MHTENPQISSGNEKEATFLPTRSSLIKRLCDTNDQKSWQEFYDTYRQLIFGAARKAGLMDAEAQDAAQETLLTVFRKIQDFQYDRSKGHFKGWLLTITRWKIMDQLRKRKGLPAAVEDDPDMNQVPDNTGPGWEAAWDEEWSSQLLTAALERIKKRVEPRQFQIFDCYVVKEWPPRKVATTLGVSIGQVYLVKHRIQTLLKKERKLLERGTF